LQKIYVVGPLLSNTNLLLLTTDYSD